MTRNKILKLWENLIWIFYGKFFVKKGYRFFGLSEKTTKAEHFSGEPEIKQLIAMELSRGTNEQLIKNPKQYRETLFSAMKKIILYVKTYAGNWLRRYLKPLAI